MEWKERNTVKHHQFTPNFVIIYMSHQYQ